MSDYQPVREHNMNDLISRNKLLAELNDQIKACERAPHDSRLYRWAAGLKAGVVIVNGLDGKVAEPATPDEEFDAIEARAEMVAEDLRKYLPPKQDMMDLIGSADGTPFGFGQYLVWTDPEPYVMDEAANVINKLLTEVRRLRENEKPITGETSDGYHTFNELYHHRAVLFSVVCNDRPGLAWKSKLHHDGTMYDGMFIVGIETPDGQATYHYDVDPCWDMFKVKELDAAPEWDGHTSAQAIDRIASMRQQDTVPVRHGRWIPNSPFTGNCSECGGDGNLKQRNCGDCGAEMDATRAEATATDG